MPNTRFSIPGTHRSLSLTTLVLALLLAPLVVLSAVQISLYYISSKDTLEEEVQRSFAHSTNTARLLNKQKLDNLARLISTQASDPELVHALQTKDATAIQTILTDWSNRVAGLHFEIMMLHDSNGNMLADISSPLINAHVFHPAMKCTAAVVAEQNWRIITAQDNGRNVAALLYQTPVIGTKLGRVQGVLCAGVLLNDNLAFVRDLKDAAAASAAALMMGEQTLVVDDFNVTTPIQGLTTATSLSKPNEVLESGAYFLSHAPLLDGPENNDLSLVIALPNTGFQALRQHYQRGTLVVFVLTGILIALAVWVFRLLAFPSLANLVDYASRVRNEDGNAFYQAGLVTEYNHLGETLHHMVHDLQLSKEHLEFLLNEMPVGIAQVDADGNITFRNKWFVDRFGYDANEVPTINEWWPRAYPNEKEREISMDRWLKAVHEAEKNGTAIKPGEYDVTCLNGEVLTCEITGITFGDNLLGTFVDLTERKRAQESIYLYANAFEHSGEATLITDAHNRILVANPAFCTLTGYALEDVIGENPNILSAGRTPPETYQEMWAALNTSGFWQGELWDRDKSGNIHPKWAAISVIRDQDGNLTHHIVSYTDISERKAAEERIYRLAHHDPLTGLLNRFSLESRLEQALMTARRQSNSVAVMFIDMDRFKLINDTLGHHVGDELLVEIAHRLSGCVRESDIVARQGGDEFVVVITNIADPTIAASVAEKIARTLAAQYLIEGHDLYTTPSTGISLFPADGDDVDTLMKNADTAMYHAKDLGRNNYQFFSTAMTEEAQERLDVERDLSTALAEGQFELYYQPQLQTTTHDVIGFEALVRWNHPERGLVPPDRFIPIAEESGLIEPLGAWVLDEACRQLAEWKGQGIDHLRIAVNISAHQLRAKTLVEQVEHALAEHGLIAQDLELEVTESVTMSDPDLAIEQLQALRNLGVSLAIDDFGTGYSSLWYLKVLPIQVLKLDRSFVSDIGTGSDDDAICAATLAMARNLRLMVVAEGVETELQGEFLASHGCDFLQGYLFGKPEPACIWTERWASGEKITA